MHVVVGEKFPTHLLLKKNLKHIIGMLPHNLA